MTDPETRLHPLDLWLVQHGIKPYAFAREHGIVFKTLYNQLNGDVQNPSIGTLLKIEAATGGAVTVQAQIDYLKGGGPDDEGEPQDDPDAPEVIVDEAEDPDAVDDDNDEGPRGEGET